MTEFKPLNLAQLYQSADSAVASAMQMNILTLQSQKMKQEYDEEDALRNLAKTHFAGGQGDLRSFSRAAMEVAPLKAPAYEKMAGEAEKAALEKQNLQGQIDERRMKVAADKLKHMNDASTVPYLKWKELTEGGLDDAEARKQVQPLYISAIRNLVSSGLFNEQQLSKFDLSEQFDPQKAEAGMRQVLGAKDSLSQYWNEKNFGQRDRHHADSLKVQIRGQEITVRGQDLADDRARQDLALKGLEVKEGEDGTYSVIDKKTNEVHPVLQNGQPMRSPKSGGTEGERISAGFAHRMVATAGILGALEKKGEGKPEILEALLSKAPIVGKAASNIFSSEDRQKYRQAQEDWVRAKLRKESGAVIGDDEMDREIRTYFPQIGDGKKVIEQKADARKTAEQGMIQNAGKAYKTPAAAPKTEIPSFATEAEAAAAAKEGKIKPGDKIKIGNQTGKWE
jgi:hypothetical protein